MLQTYDDCKQWSDPKKIVTDTLIPILSRCPDTNYTSNLRRERGGKEQRQWQFREGQEMMGGGWVPVLADTLHRYNAIANNL